MKTITLILILFPTLLSSQSLTFSGQLEPGFTQKIHHVAISHEDLSLHYFRAEAANYGISYSPVKVKGIQLGVVATRYGFPTPMDMPINFILDVGVDLKRVRISWKHISNGFGLWHRPNHGFDAISFTINY